MMRTVVILFTEPSICCRFPIFYPEVWELILNLTYWGVFRLDVQVIWGRMEVYTADFESVIQVQNFL